MKVRGYLKGKGKLGNIVCSTVAGETIARDYNPEVANPNTEAQVDQRARFKLMSQLSSIMAPVIAIPKQKSQSSRNLFVKKNIGTTVYDGVQAAINLNKVQLTNGVSNIDVIGCDRTSHESCSVYYNGHDLVGMVGMVYCIFEKDDAGNLSLLDSTVVTESGQSGDWGADLKYSAKEIVIYGYALLGDSEKARAAFGNLAAPTAESVAKLIVSSSVSASTIKTTQTKGFTMAVGIEDGEWSEDDGKVRLTVTVTGPGTADGSGSYDIGERVICTATPNTGMEFVGWYRNGSQVATTLNYQLDIMADTTIEARFREPAARHNVTASVSPSDSGSVSGTGSFEEGSNCTVIATAASGYRFKEWQKNGAQVSTSASYTFAVMEDVALVAIFEEVQSGFSNVTLNGSAWNANKTSLSTLHTEGNYNGAATVAAIIQASAAPAVGSTHAYDPTAQAQFLSNITNGAFSTGNASLGEDGNYYWLTVGTVSGSTYTVVEVYQFSAQEVQVIS
ncbi:MAG: InlB B-repeat-containing protein [Aeriscardovia sp.]|nr:InlB B-repeat-containing protein [Aeriscardovia sp.]